MIRKVILEIDEGAEGRDVFLLLADMIENCVMPKQFSEAIDLISKMHPMIAMQPCLDKEANALEMVAAAGRILLEARDDFECSVDRTLLADMLDNLVFHENFTEAIAAIEKIHPMIAKMEGFKREANALELVGRGCRFLLGIPHIARLRSPEERGLIKPEIVAA